MIKAHRNVRPNRTRSLGIECLEGRAVLSGGAHAAVAAAAAEQTALLPPTARAASTPAPGPIHLTGTTHLTNSQVALWGTVEFGISERSTETVTKGAGSISPLGQVTEEVYSWPFISPKIQGLSLQYEGGTFQTKHGKVFLSFDLQSAGTRSLEGEYTITGGTRAYSRETGSGHVQITWTGTNSGAKVTEIYS